jgi:hypothetical protein
MSLVARGFWCGPVIVLSLGLGSPAFTQECGESAVVNSTKISSTTKLALDFVKSILGGIKGEEDLVKERNSVFVQFPEGQQGIIVYTMYRDECLMIKASTTLSDVEKIDRIERLQARLLKRVSGPQPVSTTKQKHSSAAPPRSRIIQTRYARLDPPDQGLRVLAAAMPITAPNPKDFVEEETGWLREKPFYITDRNKHFVVLMSAPDEATGQAEIKHLRSKYPKYDFALYTPYGSNRNFGIMMASWVPYQIAEQALSVAKNINSGAYIWSCRSTGESC